MNSEASQAGSEPDGPLGRLSWPRTDTNWKRSAGWPPVDCTRAPLAVGVRTSASALVVRPHAQVPSPTIPSVQSGQDNRAPLAIGAPVFQPAFRPRVSPSPSPVAPASWTAPLQRRFAFIPAGCGLRRRVRLCPIPSADQSAHSRRFARFTAGLTRSRPRRFAFSAFLLSFGP